jgi:cysteine desulfurase
MPVDDNGRTDVRWLEAQLRDRKPALVAVMAANNETGVIQPWRVVGELCRHYGVPFLCDASQWIGKEPLPELGGCDFVTGCAHKFGGPAGVGFVKTRGQLTSLLYGGPQESGRRAGTENLPGVLAMMAALRERGSEPPSVRATRIEWRTTFENELIRLGATVLGAGCERLWNPVTANMPQVDCRHRWVVKLDKAGVAVTTGSACASGKEKPSHVLTAMGLPPEDAARVIRFSGGWETTADDWNLLFERVRGVAGEISR